MKVAFYMNCVSTHQLPLAREVDARVDEFTYVYESVSDQVYQQAEYDKATQDKGCLETVDLVVSGLRDLELFDRRAKKGLKTFYTSERWFKPPLGRFRMLVPGYRRMVKRFVAWVNTDPGARVLAIGPWAKGDFLRMGVKAEKIVDWGYFVEPSRFGTQVPAAHAELDETCVLRVLWAGRDIPLKHVRDIERAVGLANAKIVVDDSCSCRKDDSALQLQLQTTTKPITFTKLTGVTPEAVRKAMREHDVYVLASNGYEGWGAVVSEALEEGMNVIGTWECGACPTLLPKERLYHCGDVKALARLLEAEYRGELPACSIGEWTAKRAAERLVRMGER